MYYGMKNLDGDGKKEVQIEDKEESSSVSSFSEDPERAAKDKIEPKKVNEEIEFISPQEIRVNGK